MRLKFFSHLLLMVLLNLLVKPLAIYAIDAEVQNRVGSSAYGTYFALLNFTYLFNILLDLGITNYNTKRVASSPDRVKQVFGKILPLRLLLFVVYALFTTGLAMFLGYESEQFLFVGILIFNQFLISSTQFFRSYFAGLLLFKTEILFSILDKLLLIFAVGYVLYFQTAIEMTILLFLQIQTGIYLVSVVLAFSFLLAKTGLPKLKLDFRFCKNIVKRSIPYALLIVFMMIYHRLDSVMLERLLVDGEKETGIYAQSYRILETLFMFASMFSGLLYPLFSRMIRHKQEVFQLFDSSARILISGALIVAAVGFSNSELILNLFYREHVALSIPSLQILLLSFVPMCVIVICGTLLTANGNMKFLIRASFVGILVNVTVNLLVIPVYGSYGAAWSTLATQTAVALLQLIYVLRKFPYPFRLQGLLRYIGLAVVLLSSLYFQLFENYWLNLGLVLTLALVYCLVSDMIQWRLLLSLLRKNTN